MIGTMPPRRPSWHRGSLSLLAVLLASFAGPPDAAAAQGPGKPAEKQPDLISRQREALAAGMVAVGSAPGAIGLLNAGRDMALWGDWPKNAPDPEKAPPIDNLLIGVKDRTPTPTSRRNAEEFWGYCETIVRAAQTPAKAFATSARAHRTVTFAHLLNDPDRYRGQVIPVEGRLARLRQWEPPAYVKARGVKQLYEGWIFDYTRGTNPWCVIFADLPTGIQVGEQFKEDLPVRFEGYFFKVYRYRAVNDERYTPLLIGRAVRLGKAPVASGSAGVFSSAFVAGLSALIGGTVLLVLGLGWWFRRGDGRLRSRLAATQGEPFREPDGESGPSDPPGNGQGPDPGEVVPPVDPGFRLNGP